MKAGVPNATRKACASMPALQAGSPGGGAGGSAMGAGVVVSFGVPAQAPRTAHRPAIAAALVIVFITRTPGDLEDMHRNRRTLQAARTGSETRLADPAALP